jgi:hypothetical protein
MQFVNEGFLHLVVLEESEELGDLWEYVAEKAVLRKLHFNYVELWVSRIPEVEQEAIGNGRAKSLRIDPLFSINVDAFNTEQGF